MSFNANPVTAGGLRTSLGFTCVTPCWPVAVILGTAVMIFPAVPCVIILVVRIVMGLLEPGGWGVTVSHTARKTRSFLPGWCVSSTCSTLEGRHWDGLDDGGPRFGACRSHAQDGGFGGCRSGLHGAEEGGLFTIC